MYTNLPLNSNRANFSYLHFKTLNRFSFTTRDILLSERYNRIYPNKGIYKDYENKYIISLTNKEKIVLEIYDREKVE